MPRPSHHRAQIKVARLSRETVYQVQVSGWPVPAVNAWLAERGALPAASGAKEARHG